MRNLALVLSLFALTGCRAKTTTDSTTTSDAPTETSPVPNPAPAAPAAGPFTKSTVDAPGRVVALGDVHGDFAAMQTALKRGELIDEDGRWIGGDATLVQTGDLLDRGDDEQQIVDYVETLKQQAAAAGGQVVDLNGNHEVMNVAGDLRYVTPGGFTDFEDVDGLDLTAPGLERLPEHARPRMAAFMPGGPYARILAGKRVIAVVNDSVFAHGGVLEHHVVYGLDRLNEQTSAWMRAEADPPMILQGEDSPIWTRAFSDGAADCERLGRMLEMLGVERLVVGHTVQRDGVTSACDGKVWRIDVGMAAHYGGEPAAIEIAGGHVRVLSADE